MAKSPVLISTKDIRYIFLKLQSFTLNNIIFKFVACL